MSSAYKLINCFLKVHGTGTNSFPLAFPPHFTQVRYAKRKGIRMAKLAAKLAKKLAEGATPKPTPQRIIKRTKLSTEKDRKRLTDENWSTSKPLDDVWRTALYRGKEYSFAEALCMHRDTHHPSMLNKPDGFIYATAELDLRMKKKTQFLDEFQGVMTYPHEFRSGVTNRVIVLCKTEEDQTKAKDAGALFVGGPALVKQILSGEVAKEEYDYVVCHPDTFKECNALRGLLKKKFPSTFNGLLRLDVDRAVMTFMNGVKYVSNKSSIEPDFGWVKVCFGQLNMQDEALEENFKYMLNTIENHKSQGTEHIQFITRVNLWCQQTPEQFKVSFIKYLPHYLETGEEDEEAYV